MRHANESSKPAWRLFGRLALSACLACSLGSAPLAALAEEDGAAAAETPTTESPDAPSEPDDVLAAVKHALYAPALQTVHANEASFATSDNGACGVFAEAGAAIVANALTVQTSGSSAAAVSAGGNGGAVSIANSRLSTSGTDAPLLLSIAGAIEADNVLGTAAKSHISLIEGGGTLVIANSALASAYAGSAKDDIPASAIALFRTQTADAATTQTKAALLQISGSKMESALTTGSFFYLTNTAASIVLSDNDLEYDANNAKLLIAQGSDAASAITTGGDAPSFGTAGKNGASVMLTALDQKLEGDIEVDSISSLDLFLLDGSMWNGTSGITANAAGTDLASNIAVNIDAASGWVVTENAAVSSLNIEKGGKLVDADGKAVTIVDADGNKLVDGASDVKVSVANEFSTTVKTTSANQPQAAAIDRAAFDEEFGTSTAFGTNGIETGQSDGEKAADVRAIVTEWFRNL